MEITDRRADRTPEGVRVSARFAWEDSDRPVEWVAFDVEAPAAEFADPAPEAFVLVGALAAIHRGERRVRTEGTLCPRFRDGLRTALRTLETWYTPRLSEPVIEASGGFVVHTPSPARAGLFLSGGVDSLSALRTNRTSFGTGHPCSYRDALFVVGFGTLGGNEAAPRFDDLRARQRSSAEAISRIAGLELLVVRSSVESLGEDEEFFLRASHSAHLAAIAHLFGRRLTSVAIAASYDPTQLVPWGTHPMLDPNYGSSAVEIRHEGFGLMRRERVANVAGWKEALPHLIVCSQGPLASGRKNCGRCEKCLRTMLALMLADALGHPAPFPGNFDAKQLASIRIGPAVVPFWSEFLDLLRRRGRNDLVAVIEPRLADARRSVRWFDDRGWKGRLRRVDRRLFGGRLLDVWRRRRHSG